jgi:uncharacterized membrane protein YccF (DUF307 family)
MAIPSPGPLVAQGKPPGAGSVALNVIWLVLAGFWLALSYVIAGVIQCLFIVTIPFGIQCFKLAGFVLWPFGRAVVKRPDRHRALGVIGNVIWFFLAGIWLALAHLITGIFLGLTIIGIPLALGNFKMIGFSLAPFGKDVVRKGDAYGAYVAF